MPKLRTLTKPLKRKLLDHGVLFESATASSQIKSLLQELKPLDFGIELIRVGGESDGGYLIPKDLDGIRACYSPGVFDTSLFEEELDESYSIKSHLADYSVDGAPGDFKPKTFLKRFVGSFTNEKYITLSDWIEFTEPKVFCSEFILQMDIEGGEYETILATPSDVLRRFRIIIIEVHGFKDWSDSSYFGLVEKFFKKLLLDFYVVHVHANNCCGSSKISGIEFANIFEITLIRKDRVRNREKNLANLPHNLERKNVQNKPELQVFEFFNRL